MHVACPGEKEELVCRVHEWASNCLHDYYLLPHSFVQPNFPIPFSTWICAHVLYDCVEKWMKTDFLIAAGRVAAVINILSLALFHLCIREWKITLWIHTQVTLSLCRCTLNVIYLQNFGSNVFHSHSIHINCIGRNIFTMSKKMAWLVKYFWCFKCGFRCDSSLSKLMKSNESWRQYMIWKTLCCKLFCKGVL